MGGARWKGPYAEGVCGRRGNGNGSQLSCLPPLPPPTAIAAAAGRSARVAAGLGVADRGDTRVRHHQHCRRRQGQAGRGGRRGWRAPVTS